LAEIGGPVSDYSNICCRDQLQLIIGFLIAYSQPASEFGPHPTGSTRSLAALWAVGIGWWRNGKPERAEQLLRECLQLSYLIDDPRNGAACLEALARIAGAKNDPQRAVSLMASAEALGNGVGVPPAVLPDLTVFHEQCDRCARDALGAEACAIAHRQGSAKDFDDSAAYALTPDALN
jgi:non-specific serine/threonine protein kinase